MIPDFTPLFVVGAPRSGTTILHALVCASEKTNGYVNECSYFTALINPFLTGLGTFDTHTKSFFDTREAFASHYGDILQNELAFMWRRFDRPDILALKDPMMTPLVPHLAGLVQGSKFVVAVRDPRAVISSRIEVAHKEMHGQPLTEHQLREFCNQYVQMYSVILDAVPQLGARMLLIDYRDIVNGQAVGKLAQFGLGPIDANNTWSRSRVDPMAEVNNPWETRLHGKLPAADSLERYREILNPVVEQYILSACGPVAERLGVL